MWRTVDTRGCLHKISRVMRHWKLKLGLPSHCWLIQTIEIQLCGWNTLSCETKSDIIIYPAANGVVGSAMMRREFLHQPCDHGFLLMFLFPPVLSDLLLSLAASTSTSGIASKREEENAVFDDHLTSRREERKHGQEIMKRGLFVLDTA